MILNREITDNEWAEYGDLVEPNLWNHETQTFDPAKTLEKIRKVAPDIKVERFEP